MQERCDKIITHSDILKSEHKERLVNYFFRYLPLATEVKQNALHVIAGGYTLIPAHSRYPPLAHPENHDFQWARGRTLREHQVIYISRGEGMFESRSAGRRRVTAGTLFAIFPDEWHRYSPKSEIGWDEYWVAFDGADAQQLMADYSLTPSTPFIFANVSVPLKEEFVRLADELHREEIGYEKIIAGRTTVILAMAYAYSQRKGYEGSAALQVIEKAKNVMSSKIDEDISMEQLAASLNIGYSLFRKIFREYTGFSPAQYHLEVRINYAIKLLTTTTLPLSTVGERIGIESPGYFSRLFKRKTGCSPRDFRSTSQNDINPDTGA
jgi:AraC-like DNA-binding protein